jgi:hypothetical protein
MSAAASRGALLRRYCAGVELLLVVATTSPQMSGLVCATHALKVNALPSRMNLQMQLAPTMAIVESG